MPIDTGHNWQEGPTFTSEDDEATAEVIADEEAEIRREIEAEEELG